jgi:hypothetical protein
MSWRGLFERAIAFDVDVTAVRAALADRREAPTDARATADGRSGESEPSAGADPDPLDPSPARVVADADVLAADLLVGGDARDALDPVRAHSWVTLVASDALLDDAEAIVSTLTGGDTDLATDWRTRLETLREPVAHPPGDHPALASAYRGGAMHVLTFEEGLRSAGAGAAIRGRVETSVKHPRAFATLFDPESLYEAVESGAYPGPDRDPRE